MDRDVLQPPLARLEAHYQYMIMSLIGPEEHVQFM